MYTPGANEFWVYLRASCVCVCSLGDCVHLPRGGVKAAGVGGWLDLQDASQQVLGDSGEWEGCGASSGLGEAVVE